MKLVFHATDLSVDPPVAKRLGTLWLYGDQVRTDGEIEHVIDELQVAGNQVLFYDDVNSSMVTPADGEIFLEAVYRSYHGSFFWCVKED